MSTSNKTQLRTRASNILQGEKEKKRNSLHTNC